MSESRIGGGDVADLAALVETSEARRVLWTCQTDDLNVNLLVLKGGEEVKEHVNAEVDVLLVGMHGEGSVQIDGVDNVVRAGQALVIGKGTCRSIRCLGERFAYLVCHRRRIGLWPRRLEASTPGKS
jgi:quercetin dioxygenase-like cupin family protein